MSRTGRLGLAELTHPSFGPDVLTELARVVGANVLHERLTGETVYDDQLTRRCAETCAPLDRGLRETFLGVIDVVPVPDAPYREIPEAVAVLNERPRGSWAIFRHGDGYHAYMANGLGGAACRTGLTFQARSPEAEGLTFLDSYAAVLGMACYEMRGRVNAEISLASFDAAGDLTGRTAADVRLRGKTWARVEILGPSPEIEMEGRPAVLARVTRRGVRAETLALAPSTCVAILGLDPVLPQAYRAEDGIDRTRTLDERRLEVAKAAYATQVVETPDAEANAYPYLRVRGERVTGGIYLKGDAPGRPSVPFEIGFLPGGAEIDEPAMAAPRP